MSSYRKFAAYMWLRHTQSCNVICCRAVRPVLRQLTTKVYRETVVRPELIHKVCLGPFTHTVDDGLDSRKAAFECLDSLVDNCVDQLEPAAFIDAVISGVLHTIEA